MPSNKDLIADIEAEANAKGVDVPVTEGLSNVQLADTLKVLKSAAPAPVSNDDDKSDDETSDDETNDANDDEVEAPKTKKAPYTMAPNKAITTLKGVLAEGDEVKVEYLSDGEDGLKRHVENGNVIKN